MASARNVWNASQVAVDLHSRVLYEQRVELLAPIVKRTRPF